MSTHPKTSYQSLHTTRVTPLLEMPKSSGQAGKKRSLSPFAQIFQEFGLELDKNHYQPIEPIFSYVAAPYRPRGQYQVTITENRSLAKKEAEPFDNKATYLSDGSNRNGIYIYIFFCIASPLPFCDLWALPS